MEESGAIEKTQSGQQGRRSDEEIQGVVIRVLPPKLAHACTDGRVFRQAPRSLGYDGGWSVALGCTKITQSIIYTQQLLLRSCLAFQGRTLFNHILNQSTTTFCPQFVHLFFKFSNCAFRATTTTKIPEKIRGVLLKF